MCIIHCYSLVDGVSDIIKIVRKLLQIYLEFLALDCMM